MPTILIIEDEESIRSNVSETLGYEGFDVMEAPNGVIGVEMAQKHLPDIIVCDIMMPEMDGYDVLLNLRSNAETASIPFVFLTALADRARMRAGMEMGADDYLTKPFTMHELLTMINTRLEKRAVAAQKYRQNLDDLHMLLMTTLPHELRTPLTGIMGYSEMLMQNGNGMPGHQVVKMATAINRAGQRLQRLVENYLLYTQIELIRSEPERIDSLRSRSISKPSEAIGEIAEKKAYQAERADDLDLDLQDAVVRCSEENLQKIIGELVDNALKFSNLGSHVYIKAHPQGSVYDISIRNHGRGMTNEQINNIGANKQFQRALYEQQGAGLGLVIAKLLIELYGGELNIESIPGQTTTVNVKLPLKA